MTNNKIKERPVILSADEVRAILNGRKTQMRVPIKYLGDSPEFIGSMHCYKSDPANWGWDLNTENGREFPKILEIDCSLGKVGDRLWVREALVHKAPANHECCFQWAYEDGEWVLDWHGASVNAHKQRICAAVMPRWASRLALEIVDIQVERLQDISDADAASEGFGFDGPLSIDKRSKECGFKSASTHNFADNWNKQKAKHGHEWAFNPWVWVIKFKVVPGGASKYDISIKG